jgi:hypothetical protein
MRVGHERERPGSEAPSTEVPIAVELEYGILLGLSPQPEQDDTEGVAITRVSSWWNHLRCRSCGHTFRRGDRVRVRTRDRSVVHLVPGLGCADTTDADQAQEEIDAFRGGLLSAWPPKAGIRLQQLARDDWRIPRGPDDLRESNVCLHCGHTFRVGEVVVVCPCRPALTQAGEQKTAACGRAIHRDPALGLSCWESWRPDGFVSVCPVTQVSISET